jgi:chromosomal replication initiation ATPase DnaA
MPPPRRPHPNNAVPAASLARAALTAVLSGKSPTPAARLVVIVSAGGERLLHDLGRDVHEARHLARRLALAEARGTLDRLRHDLTAAGWLMIAAVDRIGRPARQRVIAALLDAVVDQGGMACVTLTVPPTAAGLHPALESRLVSGLVVTVPTGPKPMAAGGGRCSLQAVIRTTARLQGVPVAQLVGHDRHRSLARSRGIAMYVARACTGTSLAAIGLAFGGRDHTTAMRSVRAVETHLATDPTLATDVRDVLTALGLTTHEARPA